MGDQTKAVIDADFFIKATEYEQGTSLFMQIMHDLNMCPVMHRFVADTELKSNPYLSALISNRQLMVFSYEDYLLSDTDREEYDEYFRDAFERLNRFPFPEKEDIYEYAQPDESLGEIRSLYMTMKNDYHYFMSDDGGSKSLVKKIFSSKHAINIMPLYEALVRCKEQGTCLTWKKINPTVKNAMRSRQDKINFLRNLYRAEPDTNT